MTLYGLVYMFSPHIRHKTERLETSNYHQPHFRY